MTMNLPQALIELAVRVREKGQTLYVVGGAVRNCLLGLPYSDLDICSKLSAQEVRQICDEEGIEYTLINKWLGTIHLKIDGKPVEYTSFRRESYPKDGSHDPIAVSLGASIVEDAHRRDFSVNALYYDILAQEVIDPTKKGLEDLKRRKLATTTDDPAQIMKDDALRMLRLCRFCAELGLKADAPMVRFVRKNREMIKDIAPQRIFSELSRLLLADTKYGIENKIPAPLRGLLLLNACGLFQELFPEYQFADEIGKCQYHKYSVLFHSFHTCVLMPPTLEMRLSGLLHDIGKCKVYLSTGNMHKHELEGEVLAYERLLQLCAPKKLATVVADTVRWHMYDLTGRAKDNTVRRQIVRMGEQSFLRLITIRTADFRGSGLMKEGEEVATAEKFKRILRQMKEEGAPFQLSDLDITGDDLIKSGIAFGKQIGQILERLLYIAAQKPKVNNKQRLLHEAIEIKKQFDKNEAAR